MFLNSYPSYPADPRITIPQLSESSRLMHPAGADPQQLHARARAGGGTKGSDAIDLYLKVMTDNLWHVGMPWLITNMGFSSAVAVARGFIWARVAAQT